MNTNPNQTTGSMGDNIYGAIYLTGANVSRHSTDLQVQKTSESLDVLDAYGLSGTTFTTTSDTPPVFRVDTALVMGKWEDCWLLDDQPQRFATRMGAEKAIAEHIKDVDQANMDAVTRDDFRIEQEPEGPVEFIDIPLIFSGRHSRLTAALAEQLSYMRSPPHSVAGATNMIRELTKSHPDADPAKIAGLVNALDDSLDDDFRGAASIAVATIVNDGNADGLNAAISKLSQATVAQMALRQQADRLSEIVGNILDSATPAAMLDAIRFSPEPPAPTIQPAAPERRPSGPAPSL